MNFGVQPNMIPDWVNPKKNELVFFKLRTKGHFQSDCNWKRQLDRTWKKQSHMRMQGLNCILMCTP